MDSRCEFGRSSTVERVDVAHEAAGSIPVGQPNLGGLRLEHPEDAIYFDEGFTWPPHECTPDCSTSTSVTIADVDVDAGIVTFSSSTERK